MSIRIIQGDCRNILKTLASDSIHMVCTSPPYYGLRDYGTARWEGGEANCKHTLSQVSERNRMQHDIYAPPSSWTNRDAKVRQCTCGAKRIDSQLGLEASPGEWVANMVAVFNEVRRVLRPDGTLWLNIGDSYATSPAGNLQPSTDKRGPGSYRRSNNAMDTTRIAKPKDLLMLPARLALALQADGWWLRSDIIWAKPNPMPESVTDRPTSAHEHIFLLAKSPRYFYDGEAVREEPTGRVEPLRFGREVPPGAAPHSFYHTDGTKGRNARNVWTIATEAFPEAHFATFPTELAERCIRAGTSERGCCAQCGAPWVRVTERNLDNIPTRLATKRAPVDCEAMAAYLRERRKALGLSQAAVDEALGTRTLYSWFEGRPAGIEPPTPEQWTKLKGILHLDGRFDEQIYGTVEVTITDHVPSKAPGVRTYAKTWNAETTTTGWSSSCQCNAETKSCVVLDPFAGAGTTCLVADRLQRHAIGIELNPAYVVMARNRIANDAGMFADIAD